MHESTVVNIYTSAQIASKSIIFILKILITGADLLTMRNTIYAGNVHVFVNVVIYGHLYNYNTLLLGIRCILLFCVKVVSCKPTTALA